MAQKETGKQEILTQGQVKPPFTGPENDGSRPQADTPGPKQTEQANKWAVLVIVAIGVFMATLDSSIVNISLPTIARSFALAVDRQLLRRTPQWGDRVGNYRVSCGHRGRIADGRAYIRYDRTQANLGRRPDHLYCRIGFLRLRSFAGAVDRSSCITGSRRCADHGH